MCSYPHLQYHFDQYELHCRHRETPREVHEQRFAGSSFAHHLLQSNTNSQALPLANDQPHALSLLPGTAQRCRLGVAFSSSHFSAWQWKCLFESLSEHNSDRPRVTVRMFSNVFQSNID